MGQALAFDGVDDALTLTHTAAINGLTNDFTVAAWVKPNGLPRFSRIVSTATHQQQQRLRLGLLRRKIATSPPTTSRIM